MNCDKQEDFNDLARRNIFGNSSADPTGKVCLSFCCCRIPKHTTDWDKLLRFGLITLDKLCDNDYSLIYFHHGYDEMIKPTWKWLATCYRSFDRKFKKNIKAFYIVHPSMKLKMVFRFLKPMVSIRAQSKIVYCQSISELGQYMMLDRLDIPLEVRVHDKSMRGAQSMVNITSTTGANYFNSTAFSDCTPVAGGYRVFGGFLSDTDTVPPLMDDCIRYLSDPDHIREEGLFRRSGNATDLKLIKDCYNTGQIVDFNEYNSHTVAAVLKTYLRELAIPLLTFESYPTVSQWSDFSEQVRESICKKLLDSIPSSHYICLKALVIFLNQVIAECSYNRMDSQNISIVIGPNLTWSRNATTTLTDINNMNSFTQYLLDHPHFFEDTGNSSSSHSNPAVQVHIEDVAS